MYKLLQLTDALPGRGGGDDDRKKYEPSTSDASDTDKTVSTSRSESNG